MVIEISPEPADSDESIALVEELDAHLIPLYPTESHHGYDVQKLIREGVSFYVARVEGVAAGCGGIQLYEEYGELKRMYVRPAYRGLGLAKRMIERLENHAVERGTTLIRLETGIRQMEAIGLYERMGYGRIGPFGEYWDDPLSLFMEKRLG